MLHEKSNLILEMMKQMFIRAGFNAAGYRARYVDLSGFSEETAINHAISYGISEGRQFTFDLDLMKIAKAISDVSPSRRTYELFIWAVARSFSQGDLFRFASKLCLAPFVIFGDSHSSLYLTTRALRHRFLPIHYLCTGGLARGLSNSNSRSGYGLKISAFLAKNHHDIDRSCVLFKFWQVDVEFVFNV